MKIVFFCHSLLSDWNHGNAHFLRGVATELIHRGHTVDIYEPEDAWSLRNLLAEHGSQSIADFQTTYPLLRSSRYDPATLDLDRILGGAGMVLVHEWNTHELVRDIGAHHARTGSYVLLFHDTHHRALTAPEEMRRYDLTHYDGVLAYGNVLRDHYLAERWTARAWTWHEAADVRIFHPMPEVSRERDLVWIGNWGDEERTSELFEFLIRPARDLHLSATIFGVRYPEEGRAALREAGIEYGGYLPNFRAPLEFARSRFTIHVPRRPYVQTLRGIPTIRPFEALACGIPLISAPWEDVENLFRPGCDYLVARDGGEMRAQIETLLGDPALAATLSRNGIETIRSRHTCAHRAEELLSIYRTL